MLAEVLQWAPDGWIWVYFISSSSVLYMDLDLGSWFIAGSLTRSWWGSSGRSDCRGTTTENVEKAMAPSAPSWPSCTCLCLCQGCSEKLLQGTFTLTFVRGITPTPPGGTVWSAMPEPCPSGNLPRHWQQVLWCQPWEVSSLGKHSSHPRGLHRDIPGPSLSAPAVSLSLWPNESQQILGFPYSTRGAAEPPVQHWEPGVSWQQDNLTCAGWAETASLGDPAWELGSDGLSCSSFLRQ